MVIWIAISIGSIAQEMVEVSFTPPDPIEPTAFDLLWRNTDGITWRAETIIDYRVIN